MAARLPILSHLLCGAVSMDERLDELDQEREEFANQFASDNQRLDARIDQVRLPSPASVH